ncbi:condensin-2 complex subunit H2-like isoform X2 [Daphnia pulicaria]|uniref:condensin-2 complex subunit H2-like isoform X2 n=1 Tax=Daphnia pulicaria TaxID=35523 RepID=UPI001EEB7C89|nr:condensin-2 complex subunit H2-like isoform X2 [Daphnia pulicaria]
MGPGLANSSGSSVEEDDVFSSQFAALLKPIRELTKQGCWELNIADKLEEYVQYIQDLRIEVNVNGEQMKLDFAKAAMVVQNSAQIYSKKVEQLWLLLQEVIEFLSSNGNGNENDENQTPGSKIRRNHRKKHHKGDVDLITEPIPLKFRKFGSKLKRKATAKDIKKIQTLPYEILQLEEVIGSLNSVKIKLYTLSNEHLGYPSDLRSNFPFDPYTLFLQIHHANGFKVHPERDVLNENQAEHSIADLVPTEPVPIASMHQDDLEVEPPNLDDWQNDGEMASENEIIPDGLEENGNSNGLTEEVVERMQLRQRAPAPISVENQVKEKDPWGGMDPYSESDALKKPCGAPVRCKMPVALRKRKGVGKVPVNEEICVEIDEFLGKSQIIKKPALKYSQPETEFWEDYVHFTKTTGTVIKKQQKLRPEKNIAEGIEEMDQQDINNEDDDHFHKDTPEFENSFDNSGGLDASYDGFHPELLGDPVEKANPSREMDESKQFFELVQQFMAEYTASAKEFVTSTESTRRVQAWHDMIQPRLREAEMRRDFDIHLYGSRIIEEFGSAAPIGSQCAFTKIVHDQPKNEVARYFLATLQLANAYNVEIQLQDALTLDGVELKLLSRERHHEHMDDFI